MLPQMASGTSFLRIRPSLTQYNTRCPCAWRKIPRQDSSDPFTGDCMPTRKLLARREHKCQRCMTGKVPGSAHVPN